MSANILTNAYTLSKVGFQTEMVGYSSNRARSCHISSLRVFSHVINSFFYFTNQNLVIQYGSHGKCKLSWHIFTCLVFLFAAFLLLFFFANRAPHTGSCHAEILYWLFQFYIITIIIIIIIIIVIIVIIIIFFGGGEGLGKGWNRICLNVTAQLA